MIGQNHYKVLRIPENADLPRIHHAFRILVRRYHPDAGEGSSAEQFRAVVEAHAVLSDPEMQRDFDAFLARSRRRAVTPPTTLTLQNP